MQPTRESVTRVVIGDVHYWHYTVLSTLMFLDQLMQEKTLVDFLRKNYLNLQVHYFG